LSWELKTSQWYYATSISARSWCARTAYQMLDLQSRAYSWAVFNTWKWIFEATDDKIKTCCSFTINT
jgi:hypothetical protein